MPKQDYFKNYDYLSFQSPFYIEKENEIFISHSFSKIIKEIDNSERTIDPVSIVEFINRFYFFGNRTIVKGIKRTPWMARLNASGPKWKYADIPKHSNTFESESEIAKELLVRLKKEVLSYCSQKSKIGILLSGGMDSRIVCGVVDRLIKDQEINVEVMGLTWGLENSRDVQYAKKICEKLHWEWKHFTLNSELLKENIEIVSNNGCEVSPIHFHAIKQIREVTGIDCILAGSYGDSIGRGEYSGKHISRIKSIKKIYNWFGLLNNSVYKDAVKKINQDVDKYRKLFKREQEYQYCEIEQQTHYLRRQLNVCLSYISEKIPIYQVFTAPDTFGYIWSLNPKCRNDKIYLNLLNYFDNSLKKIPWARTGKPYLEKTSKKANYLKENNKNGLWIRKELRSTIEENIFSNTIQNLDIFNKKSLEKIYFESLKSNDVRANRIDQIMIWIAALKDFLEKYNVRNQDTHLSYKDNINGMLSSFYTSLYIKLRKFR